MGVGENVLVGVGVPVKVAGVPVAVFVKVAEMVGVGLKQALCTKLTLTSSTHQPVAPPTWSVPSLKRKKTFCPLKPIRLTVACTQPPLLPLHALRPASG